MGTHFLMTCAMKEWCIKEEKDNSKEGGHKEEECGRDGDDREKSPSIDAVALSHGNNSVRDSISCPLIDVR